MSFAPVNDVEIASHPVPGPPPATADELARPKYKSFKKKFLKLRHEFKNQMRENGRLYEEEHHATEVARRLQEQNDQLLDLLLDVNESPKIPPHFRYDLRSPTPNESDVPALEPDIGPYETHDIEGAHAALREAKAEFDSGQTTLSDYKAIEASLTAIINAPQKPHTLSNLCRVTHTKLASVPPAGMPADLVEDSPTGYLTPLHEDEYLNNLDASIAAAPADTPIALPRHSRPTDREKEKDAQLHNPVSVYNWLRNHSDTKTLPHEEKEPSHTFENPTTTTAKAKPSPKPSSSAGNGGTSSAKPSRKSAAKQEPEEELLDDEGFVIAGGSEFGTSRGKRKRDDDNTYRPKGGKNKSKKKARGNGGSAVKKVEQELEEEEEG